MSQNRSSFRRIFGNFAWLSVAEVVGRGLSFVAVVHLSRALQPAGMGVVDFGLSVFAMIQVATIGGVDVLAMRLAARSDRRLRQLAGTVVVVSWLFFGAAYLCLVAVMPLLDQPVEMKRAALLFGAASLLTPLAVRFAYLGRERMASPALASVLFHGCILVLALTLVRGREDLMLVPLIWIGCESLRALVQCAVFRRRYGSFQLRVRGRQLRAWLAASLPLTGARLGQGFLLTLDLLMLGFLLTPADVGFYGVALRIPQFLAVLALLFHSVSYPALARADREREGTRQAEMGRDIVRTALGSTVPLAFLMALYADVIIVGLFGDAYAPSIPIFRLLVWKSVLIALTGYFRNLVLARRPALTTRITGIGLAGAALVMLALIPVLGRTGAAVGTLCGESLLLVCYAAWSGAWRTALGALDAGFWLRLPAVLAAIGLVWVAVPIGDPVARLLVNAAVAGIAVLAANLPVVRRLLREFS